MRLSLTKRGEYAVRMTMLLATMPGRRVTAGELGAACKIPHGMPNLSEIWVDEQAGPREAAELLHKLVEPTVAGHPGVDVTTRAMEGPSAGTLLEGAAGAGANLLVVGTRASGPGRKR
jgi:hypothetical protein